ncbi:MAG: flagellar basal body L-ring protein FlgH [Pseudomonadota bacterium]
MMRLALLTTLVVAGCSDTEFGTPPLSPIGQGLTVTRTAIPTAVPLSLSNDTSLYGRQSRQLLTDVRASNVGDVLTVVIELDDSGSFANESERERESETDGGFLFNLFGTNFPGPDINPSANGELSTNSSSSSRGQGEIDRSEELSLRVAVIVTEVLANGNLIVSGTQEIRINQEVRVLRLMGIVNPLDVTRNNTVGYDKIAEARISYGGRGRISEVQAPRWGQQVYDRVSPF